MGSVLVFAACSEFSLIAHALPDTPLVIETVDVLADAIHEHTLADKMIQ